MRSADMTSSLNINNRKKDILIRGKGSADDIDHVMLTVEKEHPRNFTELQKKLFLTLHYNWVSSDIFVNGVDTN